MPEKSLIKDKELILNIWPEWKCEICKIRQAQEENEEWPKHCNKLMRIVMVKKYEVK